MERKDEEGLPREWVDAFQTSGEGPPDAHSIIERATQDAARSRFDRLLVVGGLCLGAGVLGLALALGQAHQPLSSFLGALLVAHLAALGYVLALGARPPVAGSAPVVEQVAAAARRSRWRYQSLWAVVLLHSAVVGLVATLFLPYVARRSGLTGPAFLGALVAVVPILGVGSFVLLRELRRGRRDLDEWRAIARSLAE
jgi:uncharacterized BrkB/YihY/UPF0761 family membrane protein